MGKNIGGFEYSFLDEDERKYWLNSSFSRDLKEKGQFEKFKKIIKKCSVIKRGYFEITFLDFDDFENELNPVIKSWYTYSTGNKWGTKAEYVKKRVNSKDNPLIIHRKEEMYSYAICNFSEKLKLSREWTSFYENSGIKEFKEKNKIGRKKFWDEAVEKLRKKYPEEIKKFEGGLK
ncbi:MAG: hypothetical protein ACRCX2_28015 [Paraclostridium sp.]